MPKKEKIKLINLIPQDEFESSFIGRILKWALSSFRVMVIFTELVVMSAFLSRFWLDARNSDLNDELEIGQAQIMAYEETEIEFRNAQQKLAIAKTIYQETKTTSVIDAIIVSMPPDIILNSMNISSTTASVKANSASESSIAQFVVNLQTNKDFSDVTITQVSTLQENPNYINFTVNLKHK